MTKCVKCNSPMLLDHIRVIDRNDGSEGDLRVKAYANPLALIFKGGVSSPLEATVCGACGYTELYALDPGRLAEAVREAERKTKG